MAGGGHRVNLQRLEHGLSSEKHIPREFFESAEYLRIAELAQTLNDLMGSGAFIQRGDDRQDVASFKVAMNWLFEQAKKGQSIQRYKGLGEMNASQLWDTTINPETRQPQVRIEDGRGRYQRHLMGDAVEPRRDSSKNGCRVSIWTCSGSRRRRGVCRQWHPRAASGAASVRNPVRMNRVPPA
jgi:DNA gyrase subunit B